MIMDGTERTNHIVAVLVAYQRQQGTLALVVEDGQRADDFGSLVGRAKLNTLLHDIARKFVFREADKVSCDKGDDLGTILVPAMLNNVLGDIVAILVGDQGRSTCMQLLENG